MIAKKWILLVLFSLLLSSCHSRYCIFYCHNETSIQSGYVVSRDDCQDEAQDRVSSARGNVGNYNAALLEAFAKCMKQKGWGVTSPKKTATVPGGPNDNSTLSGDPWAPTPYGIQQQQAARAGQVQQGYPPPTAIQQPYGYAPQPQVQQPPQPLQQAPPYQQRPQPQYNQGYYPQQPVPQQNYGYAPAPQPAPQQYNYPVTPQPNFQGGYRANNLGNVIGGPENSNRAGIGLAPGF